MPGGTEENMKTTSDYEHTVVRVRPSDTGSASGATPCLCRLQNKYLSRHILRLRGARTRRSKRTKAELRTIKEDEIGRACSTHGRKDMGIEDFGGET
jgi:hypothetical protein